MGARYDATGTQYSNSDTNPVATSPVSVGCFFKKASAPASNQCVFWYGDKDATGNYLSAYIDSAGKLNVWWRTAGADRISSASVCDDAWHHVAVEFFNNGAERWNAYLNGGRLGAENEATGGLYHHLHNRVRFGYNGDSTPDQPYTGVIAEGFLASSRCDGVIADLASVAQLPSDAFTGGTLQRYWKMLPASLVLDETGGDNLTLVGPPVDAGEHPYAVGGSIVVQAQSSYRQRRA